MHRAMFALVVGGVAGLTSLPAPGAQAASVPGLRVSAPAVQQVWYDRWGRWHPPAYGYYGPPRYYAYGPPRPYWRQRRIECVRWGRC
jgi:hypothetical protein